MTEKPNSRGSRYERKKPLSKPPAKQFSFGWIKRISLLVFLGFAFVLASYLGYLDYNVRKQFEGKRWAIPARVYANPVELYVGYQISGEKFEALLEDLHYRPEDHLDADGTYTKEGREITVKTREFTFWDQKQPSVVLRLTFDDNGIASIVDMEQNKDLALVRMDPVQIGSLYPTIKEDRILIKLEEAPDALIKGLLASEDRDFYSHFGVSFRGIARAMWANMMAGGMVQGGSTITQQLVKNFYLTSERRLSRKIKEALMSFILEYRYS
ncbi:MAG: transglycosylase domain-containing protein, partial [Methylococcales bacterium]